MALIPSSMLQLGTILPTFHLPDGNGKFFDSATLMGEKGLFVIFICNHCPYVKHINAALAPMGKEFNALGVGMVAISSNDIAEYSEDAPEQMAIVAREQGYTFPYLYDETQQVAQAFNAACTPDLYLFDAQRKLVYRGQFDSSRPGHGVADGADIRRAVLALTNGEAPLAHQTPSIGCSIKWKGETP
ncbi:MAG: thioredoxin family protein [Burkholderiales bacterium]|jgi:peroxiredoxin|nr:thioredoxin family protein [Burkholderiales bacterium]